MNGRFQTLTAESLLDLVFGCYSAFRPERAAVLMFHLERTARQGVLCHQSDDEEVLRGLYDGSRSQWVRGPAGVSLDTWRRMNRELEDEGLLEVAKKNGEPPEYTPQLAAIRIAVEQWRNRPHGSRGGPVRAIKTERAKK